MAFIEFDSAEQESPGTFIDFDLPEPAKPDDTGDFTRGAKVAAGQTKPLAMGLIGAVGATAEKAFGEGGISTAVKDWGIKGYQDGMAKIAPLSRENDDVTVAWQKAKDGDIGALLDWAQYGLGYGAVQIGEAVVTGGVGAMIGKATAKTAAKTAVENMVAKQAEKIAATAAGKELTEEALKVAATKAVANKISAIGAGVALQGYNEMMEVGSIYPEAVEQAKAEGRELTGSDLARVWGMGTLAAATESATDLLGLGAITGRIGKGLGAGMGRVARGGAGAGIGAAVEGGQEAIQTGMERIGAGKEVLSEEGQREIINAAAMGALPGGVVGGVAGALNKPKPVVEDILDPDKSLDESIATAKDVLSGGPTLEEIEPIDVAAQIQATPEVPQAEEGPMQAALRQARERMQSTATEVPMLEAAPIEPEAPPAIQPEPANGPTGQPVSGVDQPRPASEGDQPSGSAASALVPSGGEPAGAGGGDETTGAPTPSSEPDILPESAGPVSAPVRLTQTENGIRVTGNAEAIKAAIPAFREANIPVMPGATKDGEVSLVVSRKADPVAVQAVVEQINGLPSAPREAAPAAEVSGQLAGQAPTSSQLPNPEARSTPPVAESQAPAPSEPGDSGVAPTQEGVVPESPGLTRPDSPPAVTVETLPTGSTIVRAPDVDVVKAQLKDAGIRFMPREIEGESVLQVAKSDAARVAKVLAPKEETPNVPRENIPAQEQQAVPAAAPAVSGAPAQPAAPVQDAPQAVASAAPESTWNALYDAVGEHKAARRILDSLRDKKLTQAQAINNLKQFAAANPKDKETLLSAARMIPQLSDPRKRAAPKQANTLIAAIVQRGGINRSIMQDVGADPRGRYAPGLFTNNGTKDLSGLAEYLANEDGFFIPQDSDIGPARELEELLVRSLGGETILSLQAMERQQVAEQNAEIMTKARAAGIKTAFRKIEDIAAELAKYETDTLAQAGVLDDTDEELQALNAYLEAFEERTGNDDAFNQYVAAIEQEEIGEPYDTEGEIAAQDENDAGPAQGDRQVGSVAAGQPQEGNPAGEGTDREQGFSLEQQTLEDLAAKAARAANETVANREAADRERDVFALTPQTQERTQGATQQGGLFTPTGQASQQAKETPPASSRELGSQAPRNGMQERAVRAEESGSPELAQSPEGGAGGRDANPTTEKLRVVDLFGNGSRVQHFDDKKGLYYESQKYPSRTGWRAGEVIDGQEFWLSDKEFPSMDEAMASVRKLRISNSIKARNAERYGDIPNLWDGDAKKVAKALIDAGIGVSRFSQSTQSKSKYIYLDDGRSVRLSDHDLPGTYDAADIDYRYGGDIKELIKEIQASVSPSTESETPAALPAAGEFSVKFIDDNENAIIYESEDFRMSVNRPGAADRIVLWAKQEVNGRPYWRKAGVLDANQKRIKGNEYLSVSSIEIDKQYRGSGFGTRMFRALLEQAAPEIQGIVSYTPNRVNKKQIPRIYKRLGATENGDYQIISRNQQAKLVGSSAAESEPSIDDVSRAKEILDAAGITGTDRTTTIAAVRRGDLTAEDVAEAHPGKEVESQNDAAEPPPQYEYAKPSTIDTPAQGVLNAHRERKALAYKEVKRLREAIKNEPMRGNRSGLRLELLNAEEKWREAQRGETQALDAIEKRANELGKTTIKPKGDNVSFSNAQEGSGNIIGDPSPEEAEKVQSAIEGRSVMEAAEYVRDNSENPSYRVIAERVIAQLRKFAEAGQTFSLHVAHEGDRVPRAMEYSRGVTFRAFDSNHTEIWLQGTDMAGLVGMSHETILHELVHAVTQATYYYGKKRALNDPAQQRAVDSLFSIQEAVAKHVNARIAELGTDGLEPLERTFLSNHNAMRDPDEVLAWGMTNPRVQRYLESIPYESGTLWTRFVDTIRQILGLPTRVNTALSELLKSAETLLNADAYPLVELPRLPGSPHTHINQTRGLLNAQTGSRSVDALLSGESLKGARSIVDRFASGQFTQAQTLQHLQQMATARSTEPTAAQAMLQAAMRIANPSLARGESTPGASVEQVTDWIAEAQAKLKNIPSIRVVQVAEEIPAVNQRMMSLARQYQENNDQAAFEELFSFAANPVEGAYVDGEIWLVASSLKNRERALNVLAHEAVGHMSVEQMLDAADPTLVPKLIKNVILLDKGGNPYIRSLAADVDRTQPGLSQEQRAKEIIAQIAERGDQGKDMTPIIRSLWQKILDGIKAFYKLVFDQTLSDQDVRDIVATAERWAQGEEHVTAVINGGAQSQSLSRGDQTDSEAFAKWFGASVVTDNGFAELLAQPNGTAVIASDLLAAQGEPNLGLHPVQALMLAMSKNDKVGSAIVNLVPINVMDILTKDRITTKNTSGNVAMFLDAIRHPVSDGTLLSFRSVLAQLSTKLSDAIAAGRDKEILPAVRASDLNLREVGGLLSLQSGADFNSGSGRIGAVGANKTTETPALSTNTPASNLKLGPTELARLLNQFMLLAPHAKTSIKDNLQTSAIIARQGKPLVVYHGSNADITQFSDKKNRNGNAKEIDVGGGIYLARESRLASIYAGNGAVYPLYVAIKNPMPFEVENGGNRRGEGGYKKDALFPGGFIGTADEIAKALAHGYDGIIRGDEIIAFRPEQIKSAIGNRGTFDPENPDIRYSRQAALPGRNPTLARALDIADNFTGESVKSMGSLRNVVTQLHKARKDPEHFGRVFNLAMEFRTDLSRSAYRAWEQAKDILPAYNDLGSATKALLRGKAKSKELTRVGSWIFDGTTYGGGNPLAGMRWTASQLKSKFNATAQEIAMYEQARDAIDASLDEVANSVAWKLAKPHVGSGIKKQVIDNPTGAHELMTEALGLAEQSTETSEERASIVEAIAAVDAVYAQADKLKAAGYAPLSRFGRYTVDVFETGPDGKIARDSNGVAKRLEFRKFEFESEAKAAEKELRKEYAGRPNVAIKRGIQAEKRLFSGVDPETVTLFAEKLADIPGLDVKREVLDAWRREAVSQRSAIMRNIKRKGIAGYSDDMPRVLATFLTSNARYASSNFHMADMQKAIDDIPDAMGDVKDEATELFDYINASNEPGAWMRGLMFAWYLGGSPAAAAVNLTQPVLMTFPYLSQFGSASKHLVSSVHQAMRPMLIPVSLRQVMSRAMEEGLVEAQEIHHLYDEGMKPIIARLPGGEDIRARAQGAATLWGAFFGMAENFNRRITFLAAYKMAQDMGNAQLKAKGFEDAYAFAKRAVEETQGIYAKENRPNWARGTGTFGAVGVAAFTFKQFSIQYVELLSRMYKSGPEGKKAAGLMLGLLILASGIQGAPGADDLDDLIDTILQSLGYRGNIKKAKRDALRALAGERIADIVMYGLSAETPIDVQSRLGLGNLIPATGLFKPSEKNKAGQIAEILGPPGGMAKSVGEFIDASQSGQHGSAFAALSPVFIKNIAKAVQMADTGEYKDSRGRKVEDVDMADAIIKGIGFQPQEVASESRKAQMLRQDIARVRDVESDIASVWAQGIAEKDSDEVKRARAMLKDWNEKNPETPIRVNHAQILRRVREMKKERSNRMEKTAPKEMRRYARESIG